MYVTREPVALVDARSVDARESLARDDSCSPVICIDRGERGVA
jgi:hypothetical protein|tara:strand:+ start:855 stop:983 length:129 start_codon:yes stop_codon:yes gene_type:complete